MPDKTTLNRFPLFGLFAYRAARRMSIPKRRPAPRLFNGGVVCHLQGQGPEQEGEAPRRRKRRNARGSGDGQDWHIEFGGQEFTVIDDKGKRPNKTVVGHELQIPRNTIPRSRPSSRRAGMTGSPRRSTTT